MSNKNPIRVLLVDDHDMVRTGLATFLMAFDDLELAGEASGGKEALQLCMQLKPDVVLMDLVMPGMNGAEVTRAIRETHPEIQVVALTSFEDKDLVQSVLKAGAIGYLLKGTSPNELADAIRAARAGKPTLAPEATQALIDAATQPSTRSYELTNREGEVLSLLTEGLTNAQIAQRLTEGLTNAQIAQRLTISRSTVKTYVSSILSKMGAASRTEAVAIAVQDKLVT